DEHPMRPSIRGADATPRRRSGAVRAPRAAALSATAAGLRPGAIAARLGSRPATRLRMNVLWTLAGNAVYGFCQWAMLIALAKMGTPEIVGQFALAFAITAPAIMAANLNLRTIIATDAQKAYTFSDYIGLRLLSIAAADVVLSAIVGALYRREVAAVILVVALAKSIEAI